MWLVRRNRYSRPAVRAVCRSCRTVELHNRPAAVGGRPTVVLRVNGEAKTDAFSPAAGKPRGLGRHRLAIRREFGKVASPQRIFFGHRR
jgi:hypothetical protein